MNFDAPSPNAGPLSGEFVVSGHKLLVTLTDADINYDPLKPERVTVVAASSRVYLTPST